MAESTTSTENYLALDLGAESGRGVLGAFNGETVALTEVHRFPNTPVQMGDTLHWDLPALVRETQAAISAGVTAANGSVASVGVDTWGVDFGLIGKNGELVGLPVHYRDKRTNGMVENVFEKIPGGKSAVWAKTGLQTMPINTLFQLAALRETSPKLLDAAEKLLFMPDLLHYYLTGQASAEYTIASTSQMLNAQTRQWETGFAKAVGVRADLLPSLVPAGTNYGPLLPSTATGNPIPVIAPGGHDTACAVAAVPAEPSGGWAYLSSGTWSLLGVEIDAPLLSPEAEAANITNEGGVCGTIRLLKNIAGLWLVQECRRAYARLGSERTYEQLTRLAETAPPLASVFDPDHASLIAPPDMPRAIRELCGQTGEVVPEGIGATVRAVLDSLALKYRRVLQTLENLTGQKIHTLHIGGGGSQNRLLNQLAADATGRVVIAGPVEATALGNVLLQARALGRLDTLADIRAVVRASFAPKIYLPNAAMQAEWDEADARLEHT